MREGVGWGVGAYGGYKTPKYRRLFSKNTALPEDFFQNTNTKHFLHLYHLQVTPSCTVIERKQTLVLNLQTKHFAYFRHVTV